jgi:hypothetical protein
MFIAKLFDPQHRVAPGLLALCSILLFCSSLYANELVNLTLHDEVYTFIKRLAAKNLIEKWSNNSKPLKRREVAEALLELTEKQQLGQIELTDIEKSHLERFQWLFGDEIDALKPGFLPRTKKTHAFTLKDRDYRLDLDLKLKQETSFATASSEDKLGTSITSTNLALRAKLGRYLGVSSIVNGRLLLGSGTYNPYRNERANPFSELLKGESRTLNSMTAYAALDLPWLSLQWGIDDTWWGPGWHGALMISDNPAPTDTLKISGSYGPLRFIYLTSILRIKDADPDEYYPKYMSAHRLEISPYPGINVGLSEAMVFVERYEPRYLNPFLIYFISQVEERRSNGMLGFDVDITLIPSVEFYAEIMVDDFQTDRGWEAFRVWDSKYGVLVGGYWADPFGLKDTDARIEYAFVNQYAYTNTWANFPTEYTHEGFVIGHWMGTDADDLWLEVKHWLTDTLRVSLAYELERQGEGDVNKRHTFEESVERPTESTERWEFLSGVAESTHSISAGLTYVSIGRWTASMNYVYSQTRNAGHKPGVSEREHRLVMKAEHRF